MPDRPGEPAETVAVPIDLVSTGDSGGETVDQPDIVLAKFEPPSAVGDLGRLGSYRVVRQLGRGGMGAVYLGVDESLDREVALKVMLPSSAANPAARERFLREARAAAKVKSDHVVTIYQVGESGGTPYIAMEFLHGQPLDDYVKTHPLLAVGTLLRVARDVATGLAAAHALGVVHRDIKPANLWVESPSGRVKILDFGLARKDSDAQLTKTGAAIGTPAFMSPEQARGDKVDGRTDLFSLGGVLYRLCTGRLPFPGDSQIEVLTKLATQNPTPVLSFNPTVPPALADLIHRLLAKHPDDRPQCATEVLDAINAVESPRIPSPPPTAHRPASKRSRFWVATGGLGLFLLGVGSVAGFLALPRTSEQTEPPASVSAPPLSPDLVSPVTEANRTAVESVTGFVAIEYITAAGERVHREPGDAPPAGPFRVVVVEARGYGEAPPDFGTRIVTALAGQPVERLNLWRPDIEWTPDDFARFTEGPARAHLTSLSVRFDLSPKAAERLAGFRKLEDLAARATSADDAVLKRVEDLPALTQSLTLENLGRSGRVTSKGWASLAHLRVRHLGLVSPVISAGAMTGLPQMPNLETLTLTGADLAADETTQLGRCGRLLELNLSGSKFGPQAGRELGGLSKLQRLDVSFTDKSLNEHDVGVLAKLTRLRALNVSETPLGVEPHLTALRKAIPRCVLIRENSPEYEAYDPHFREASRLLDRGNYVVSLDTKSGKMNRIAKVTPELPDEPFELVGIQWTGSEPPPLDDAWMQRLEATSKLREFVAPRWKCTAAGLQSLAKSAKTLQTLSLADGGVTDELLPLIAKFEALDKLTLINTTVTDDGILALAPLKKLRLLGLKGTRVTATGKQKLQALLPDCMIFVDETPANPGQDEAVALDWAIKVKAKGVGLVVGPAKKFVDFVPADGKPVPEQPFAITSMNLDGLKAVTDDNLPRFDRLASLDTVVFSQTGIGNGTLKAVANAPLTHLYLSETRITDEGLKALAGCTKLRTLHLNTTAITDTGLEHLAGLTALRELHVDCVSVTKAGAEKLATALPKCEIVYKSGTKILPK